MTSAISAPATWWRSLKRCWGPWKASSDTEGTCSTGTTPSTLAPLAPRYVSTVDSGNLAGALLTLAEGLRDWRDRGRRERSLAAASSASQRARSPSPRMNFRFLFDPERQIFSIGYRLADAEGPGRLDPSYYDLLASEARLASFVAIAKGEVPESHWFHLGRLVTSVEGTPTLLSWSATLFEYLMPLLVCGAIPRRCSSDRAAWPCAGRSSTGGARRPWGISESAYNVVDRHGNYQYKAFGVPGLGLKRGLGDELVMAPTRPRSPR